MPPGLELTLAILLIALAVAPLFRGRRRADASFHSASSVFLLVGALFALGWGWARSRETRSPNPTATNRPVEAKTPGFITSNSCRSCHPQHYASWRGSYHSTMTRLPTADSVMGDFNDAEAHFGGNSFRMQRKGGDYWIEMPALREDGSIDAAQPARERKIALVTGSHHYQVYWFSSGHTARMDQFPLVWLIKEQRWVPRESSFLVPPHQGMSLEEGRWNEGCIRCHTTGGNPNWHSHFEMYPTAAEFGISCEACHGPAEEHVAINGNPLRRYTTRGDGAGDETSTLPTSLKAPLDSQVCGQCHSVNVEASVALREEWRKQGYSYRPGDDLHKERDIFRPTDPAMVAAYGGKDSEFIRNFFWSDGMIRVAGREYNGLLESPCHQHADEERRMSCFSCHQLHGNAGQGSDLEEWADDQLKPGMRGNQACLQCHEDFGDDIAAHTHHAPDSSGSLCYNCHMSHTTYGLLGSIRSHQIDSPDVATSLATGRPNACNQCHLDQTLDWAATHLNVWYDLPRPELSADEKEVAASVLWTLKGDAGQRALMAWSLGWEPAVEASADGWREPYLAHLLEDPYDAIRFMAQRSLRKSPGFEDWEYDHLAEEKARKKAAENALETWKGRAMEEDSAPGSTATLLKQKGELDAVRFGILAAQRDDTPIVLSE